jgi:hypothetical protein
MRGAQQTLARRTETADPFYWSGLMLIGDGSIHVALRARGASRWVGGLGAGSRVAVAGGVLGLLAGAVLLRARRTARRQSEARDAPANDAVRAP